MSTAAMEIPYTVQSRPDTGLYNGKVGIWLFLASEVMLFGALFSSYIMLRVGSDAWPSHMLNVPIGTLNTTVLISSSITVVLAWAALKLNEFSKFRLYMGLTVVLALTFAIIKSFEYRSKFIHYAIEYTHHGEVVEATGHIEGSPWNWSLKTLRNPDQPIESIVFHPDAAGHGSGHADEAAHGGGHEAVTIATSDIRKLESFGPWHNTYLAIYFTLTGLHALHVIGGALVLGWFWITGPTMWRTEPERLTNRVEVTGLFWHFVDLVWIFLFPVLYLL
jgi:cytochrome c oxidase subunit 3